MPWLVTVPSSLAFVPGSRMSRRTPLTVCSRCRSSGRAKAAIDIPMSELRHFLALPCSGIIASASAGAIRSHDTSSDCESPGVSSWPSRLRK